MHFQTAVPLVLLAISGGVMALPRHGHSGTSASSSDAGSGRGGGGNIPNFHPLTLYTPAKEEAYRKIGAVPTAFQPQPRNLNGPRSLHPAIQGRPLLGVRPGLEWSHPKITNNNQWENWEYPGVAHQTRENSAGASETRPATELHEDKSTANEAIYHLKAKVAEP